MHTGHEVRLYYRYWLVRNSFSYFKWFPIVLSTTVHDTCIHVLQSLTGKMINHFTGLNHFSTKIYHFTGLSFYQDNMLCFHFSVYHFTRLSFYFKFWFIILQVYHFTPNLSLSFYKSALRIQTTFNIFQGLFFVPFIIFQVHFVVLFIILQVHFCCTNTTGKFLHASCGKNPLKLNLPLRIKKNVALRAKRYQKPQFTLENDNNFLRPLQW